VLVDPPESGNREVDAQVGMVDVERAHILAVLQETGWRIRGPLGAAARLRLKPTTIESRMKKLSLTRPGRRSAPYDFRPVSLS
jgi:transcriptional regulator with GAF, ATPase, and Fis domain